MQVSNIGVCYTNLGKLQEAAEVLSPSIKDWDDVSSLKLVYTTLRVLTASLNGFQDCNPYLRPWKRPDSSRKVRRGVQNAPTGI
jgi:hypothetical protein